MFELAKPFFSLTFYKVHFFYGQIYIFEISKKDGFFGTPLAIRHI